VLRQQQAKSAAELSSKATSDPNFVGKVLKRNNSKTYNAVKIANLKMTAYKRGVNIYVIKSIRDMYKKLNGRVKVTISTGMMELTPSIPVKKGIRQGAVTSPPLFNETIIVP